MHEASIKTRASMSADGQRWAVDVSMSWDKEDPFQVELIFAAITESDIARWVLPVRMFLEGVYLCRETASDTSDDPHAFLVPMDIVAQVTLAGRFPAQYLTEETMVLHLMGDWCPNCGQHRKEASVFLDREALRRFCDDVHVAMSAAVETVVL